jgi:hypothetical protein
MLMVGTGHPVLRHNNYPYNGVVNSRSNFLWLVPSMFDRLTVNCKDNLPSFLTESNTIDTFAILDTSNLSKVKLGHLTVPR